MTNIFKEKYKENLNNIKIYKKEKIIKEEELEKKNNYINNHLRALEILYILRTSKINEKRDKILSIVNLGCKDIFQKNYELKIISTDELEKSNVKEIKYHIILYKNDIEVARNEKLLQTSGGGVLSVISVLIKLVINIIYNKDKFFIFDEAMSQVSENYQPRLSAFLQRLCESQQMCFVLISHMSNLANYADYVYSFSGTVDKDNIPLLVLENKLDINTYPQYHLKIKNFQSIVDLDLIFSKFVVIEGSNDIGKSAIVRAINAILNNSFQENYIRLKKNRFDRCSIQFSKYLSEDKKIFDIKMVKEPTGIVYEIDNEEFRGKSLAKDSIGDKLNEFGYGNILSTNALGDLKKSQRNKFGNITITNQNDQLYLLDNTASENNKIISYIFQASTINNGIIKIKEKIKIASKEKSYIQDNLNTYIKNLDIKEKENNILHFKYLNELLMNMKEIYNDEILLINSIKKNKVIDIKYTKYILLMNIQKDKLKLNYFNLNELNNKKNINKILDKIDNLNELKNKSQKLNLIYKINKLNNDLNFKSKSIKLNKIKLTNNDLNINVWNDIKKLNNKINKILKLRDLNMKLNKIDIILNNQNNLFNKIDKNKNKYKDLLNKIETIKIIYLIKKDNDKLKNIYILMNNNTKNSKNNDDEIKNLKENHICKECNGLGYVFHEKGE